MANIYSGILSGTMDAFASVISNNLNIVMKFLATVTIVLSIPTMIFSAYGMNVSSKGMPFADSPMGFVFVILFSIVLSLVVAFIFRKKDLFLIWRLMYGFINQTGEKIWKVCHSKPLPLYRSDVCGRLSSDANLFQAAGVSDAGTLLYSAGTGVETGELAADSAGQSQHFYDHYAAFLLFRGKYPGENLGDIPV